MAQVEDVIVAWHDAKLEVSGGGGTRGPDALIARAVLRRAEDELAAIAERTRARRRAGVGDQPMPLAKCDGSA